MSHMLAFMGSGTGTAQVDTSELNEIAWHWEKADNVSHDGSVDAAVRIGYPEHILTADTPADTPSELRAMIRSGYLACLASLSERLSL